MLTSVLEDVTGSLSIQTSLLCTLVSVVLGLVLAVIFMTQGTYTVMEAQAIQKKLHLMGSKWYQKIVHQVKPQIEDQIMGYLVIKRQVMKHQVRPEVV